jgi:hypothetical protein
MLECSKNVFAEIPITLLDLKIICQSCGKIIRKTSLFTNFSTGFAIPNPYYQFYI